MLRFARGLGSAQSAKVNAARKAIYSSPGSTPTIGRVFELNSKYVVIDSFIAVIF